MIEMKEKIIKLKSKLYYLSIIVSIIIIALILYFKPFIQDEGWATSFIVSKIKYGNPFQNGIIDSFDKLSYRTYYNWFNFIPLEISIRTFGVNILAARIPILIYAVLLLISITYFFKKNFDNNFFVLIPLYLVLMPFFNMHLWTRAEIPASFFSILAIVSIHSNNRFKTFFSILFLIVSFDIHPVSLFLTLPFLIFKFDYKNITAYYQSVLSLSIGLIIILSSKIQFFEYSSGIIDFLAKSLHLSGGSDHYSPIFKISEHDFISTEKIRLLPFFIHFLPILILLIFNLKSLSKKNNFKYYLSSFLTGIILSILITDTLGNGYQLYMFLVFVIFGFFILSNIHLNFINKFILIFLIAFTLKDWTSSIQTISNNISNKKRHEEYYSKIERLIPNSTFLAARPQYFFSSFKKNVKLEYWFTIFLESNNSNILTNFENKKYQYIIIDKGFEDLIITENKQISINNLSYYYKNLPSLSELDYNILLRSYTLIYSDIDPIGQQTKIYKKNE
jgi:hypothetical protein